MKSSDLTEDDSEQNRDSLPLTSWCSWAQLFLPERASVFSSVNEYNNIATDNGCPKPGTENALNRWAGTTVSSKFRPWGGSKKTRLPLCAPEPKDRRSGRAPCPSPGKLKVSARRVLGPQCGEGSDAPERAALLHPPQAIRVARVPKRAHLKPPAPGVPAALQGCPDPSLVSAEPRPAAAAPLPPKPAPRCDSPAPAPGKVWWRGGSGGQAAGCAAGAAAGAPGSALGGGAREEEPRRGGHL